MTGPEHYSEAEKLLAAVWDDFYPDQTVERGVYVAAAQVHATLALAAAVAAGDRESPIFPGMPG